METTNRIDALMAKMAADNGREALENARRVLQSAMDAMDHHIASYDRAENLKDKAKVLNWSIGHLTTYIPMNVRLDMLATRQAELVQMSEQLKLVQ